jgi:enoyl-CoA hydratase/carnithine racemase
VFITNTEWTPTDGAYDHTDSAFCTGIDMVDVGSRVLNHQQDGADFPGQRELDSYANFCSRLGHIRKPICAVGNGLILGAGSSLFLNANIRISTPESSFAVTDPSMGLTPVGVCPFQ